MQKIKLTLRIEKTLVEQARTFAAEHQTSLSSMFDRYLGTLLHEKHQTSQLSPGLFTGKATGLAKSPTNRTDQQLIEDALVDKYGLC